MMLAEREYVQTKLLSELCRSLRKASSAREVTLPPAFL